MFEAATAELAESGYAGTSLDRIAARSGVSLSTLYRRWGTLDRLIRELVDESTVPLPDEPTGDLERDLTTVARAVLTLSQDPVHHSWMDALVSAAVHDPEARAMLSHIIAGRIERVSVLMTPAVEALGLAEPVDTRELARLIAAPFYYRTYISGEPHTERLLERTVARVAAAVRAGAVPVERDGAEPA
ncbi:TetR/AcrR family transcriptional regulator [Agromyces sp. MMS24-K17]|uniref:TetR/AcrR family transcriptional regulator n=1 Tax=Agromyces sp. MMS24-K17 TaxID=3372850 RepID=UPI003753F818